MSHFVLVHGSWHDGSVWQPVVRELERHGHRAFTPTIAGHGKGADKRGITHAHCTQSITEYIVSQQLTDIVLLGHSFAGTIIAKVAETIPQRIRRLVFWNAFVLLDGNCLMDDVPQHYHSLFAQLAAASNDNTVMLPFAVWREAFINDADLELATQAYSRLSPEPYQPFLDRLDMKKFFSLELPRSYVNCTEDIALPPGEWGWHPRMSARLGLCRLVQMPGSHEVLFTNPAGLAQSIIQAGRD